MDKRSWSPWFAARRNRRLSCERRLVCLDKQDYGAHVVFEDLVIPEDGKPGNYFFRGGTIRIVEQPPNCH